MRKIIKLQKIIDLQKIIKFCLFCLPVFAMGIECKEVHKTCIEPDETRIINGVEIYQSCWKYKTEILCESTLGECVKKDLKGCKISFEECGKVIGGQCVGTLKQYLCTTREGCEEEKNSNCVYVDEECASSACNQKKINYSCVIKYKYENTKARLILDNKPLEENKINCDEFCLDGSCIEIKKDQKKFNEKNFNDALAGLSGLKSAANTINSTGKTVNIFGGAVLSCDTKIANYMDCCSLNGWGKALGDSCGKDAKALQEKRKNDSCTKIGTYCKSKFLGVCAIRRSVFCCFENVIIKIFNIEGKKQLGITNGTARRPACGGFSLMELQKIDFKKADLRGVYSEIAKAVQIPEIKQKVEIKTLEELSSNNFNEDDEGEEE